MITVILENNRKKNATSFSICAFRFFAKSGTTVWQIKEDMLPRLVVKEI